MKINIDTKKGTEAVTGFLQKTSDLGKKTISDVQSGAVALSEKAKQDSYQRRLRKYNPLFPDVYRSESFNLPNMIMIRDDAERKGIDVCEGAIGWLGNAGGVEVLYLYDEFIPDCGITFVPSADCDAIYYVDKFDRKKFIRTDCLFKIAHDERLAELEHIAYSLGATHCTIEIVETEKELKITNKKYASSTKVTAQAEGFSDTIDGEVSAQINNNFELTQKREDSRFCESTWEGSDQPKKPKLKWFAYDNGVKGLIEMRCRGGNKVSTRTLRIQGSSSVTMSKDTAYRIDSAVNSIGSIEGKISGKRNAELASQATKEMNRIFIFTIDF